MAYEVAIEKTNNTHLTVLSDEPCVHEELYEFFKVEDPSHVPSRFSKYDGMVRLYDKNTGRLPTGLLKHLIPRLKNYKVNLDPRFKNMREFTKEELQEWIDQQNLPWPLHDYQFQGVYDALRFRRLTLLADTGAGKSVMIYLVIKFLLESGQYGRTLILAPSILLVEQILADFISYGWKEAEQFCQKICDGRSKFLSKKVVISTWQSLQDLSQDYFEEFDTVICDEVHGASAKKQSGVISKCRNAVDRIGFTGTLNGTELHQFQVEGLFGPCVRVIDTQGLKERGQASETEVVMVNLKYNSLDSVRMSKLDYEGQVQYIMSHKERQSSVARLVAGLSSKNENTLVLFDRVENGLYKFKEILEEMGLGDKVRIIEGDVKLKQRFETKNEMEDEGGLILLATWGTMSTGVSIKRLHNIVFNSSTKGMIRVLQSLGRVLRIHDTKSIARLFDIIDDCRKEISSRCHFIDHAIERHKFYKMKKHPVKSLKIPLGVWNVPREEYEAILKDSEKRIANREARSMSD